LPPRRQRGEAGEGEEGVRKIIYKKKIWKKEVRVTCGRGEYIEERKVNGRNISIYSFFLTEIICK